MRRVVFYILAIGLLSCTSEAGSGGDQPVIKDGVTIHSYEDFTESLARLNSHSGETSSSCLQLIRNRTSIVPHAFLTAAAPVTGDQKTAMYPRIKKAADGSILMFYHGSQYGSRIFLTKSRNLLDWTTPVMLYSPYAVTIDGAEDIRRFVNMDAVVLPDGEILAVCSYRAESNYSKGLGCGLMLIRSKDNGESWSQPRIIYEGPNWEPYLLYLPDGRVQCYFTDATPQTRNSGTSVIVSSDRGATWTEKIRCCRLYKYLYDGENTEFTGQKIFTDQMPCFRILNDGKTLFGFLEDRLETPASISGSSSCKMSLVWNEGFEWKDLGEENAGPQKRLNTVVKGAGGYVEVFPSGEVVLSCGRSSLLNMKIIDSDGGYSSTEDWNKRWYTPFAEKGFWGCMERMSPHTLAAAMHCSSGMQIGLFWLNHRIDAFEAGINCDGDPEEWTGTEAFFLGTSDGTEVLIRTARDKENLYLLAEFICAESENPRLDIKLLNKDGDGTTSVSLSRSSLAVGKGESADGRSGFAVESVVPVKNLGNPGQGDIIKLFATLQTSAGQETFSLSDITSPATWQTIRFQ